MVKVIGRLIAGLKLPAIYNAEAFYFSELLHKSYPKIREEWEAFFLKNHQKFPSIQQISKSQYELTDDQKWNAIFLFAYDEYFENTIEYFPTLKGVLNQISAKKLVFFSVLQPKKSLKRHKGHYAGLLRLHLGIDVPDSQNQTLMVEKTPLKWQNGQILVFDDSREHEVINQSEKARVVLIIDFERPLPLFYKTLNKVGLWFLKKSDYIKSAKNNAQKLKFS